MTLQYLHVTQKGIEYISVDGIIPLEDMKDKVGTTNEKGWIEGVFHQFSDETIVIVCDDEGLRKKFPVLCMTWRNVMIHGDFIIANIKRDKNGERDLYGLSTEQIDLVKNEMNLISIIDPRLAR